MRTVSVIAVSVLLAGVASCTTAGTTESDGSTVAGPTVSAPVHTAPDDTAPTTDEPAVPPVTDADGNIPAPDPVGGASLRVDPTSVRIGESVTITVECPLSQGHADAWFGLERPTDDVLIVVPPAGRRGTTTYETVAIVPFWVDTGESFVRAGCVAGVRDPEPVAIDVLPSDDGIVELWRPIRDPWVDASRSPGSPVPEPLGRDDREYAEPEGGQFRVHAFCPRGIPARGARFTVWQAAIAQPPLFYALEVPVAPDAYEQLDDGVVISALIDVDAISFPAENSEGPFVAALCVETPTPFVPGPTQPDEPSLTLHIPRG